MTLHTLAPALLGLALSATATAGDRFDFDRTPGQLPKAVRPLQQSLTLDVDPDRDSFSGRTAITLQVRQPVDAIVLHAHQLQATRSVLLQGRQARALNVLPDPATQTWRLVPADGRPVGSGRATLQLHWTGRVQDTDGGLYRAPYQAGGTTQRMLATQMQAVFARMTFPLFDEPAFRARFQLDVRAPAGYQVLSNMPQASQRRQGGQVLHRFATTPPMPSYLVAVSVGRYDALQGRAGKVPLRVLTAPGKGALGAYALQATQQILPYYEAYFGLPYALPKLDQLAVPSTRNGAMEDWGLISYAEGTLLFDPATSNPQQQRGIFSIVAHEVAHQWFGNLVTAASWEEIWLNEAFATWMADKASAHFNPQWQLPLRHRRQIDHAMERDGGASTRAIRSGPVREDSVFDVFDDITYTKGGAVLGMLEQWIGEDAFRRGLAAYMKERRLSNATAGDLWFHMGRASGSDVSGVAASWTDQKGFPLVRVDSRCEGGSTWLDTRQQAFTHDGSPRSGLWQVPLVLLHDGRLQRALLTQEQQRLQLPGCPALPTVVNPQGVGFYRVAYGDAQRQALAAGFGTLPPAAQVTLLSDSFALAQAGQLPLSAWLDLLPALAGVRGDTRPALLGQAQAGLRVLDEALAGTPAQQALRSTARALLAPELRTLGWDRRPGDDAETTSLRAGLISDLARYGDSTVVARAQALFDADEAGTSPLPAPIRSAVIRAVGWHADAARFDALRRRLLQARLEEDRWLLASALALAPDPALAQQALALALDDTLPPNVATRLPGMVGDGLRHGELAYRFVLQHFDALGRRSGDMFGARAWLLPGAAYSLNDGAAAARLRADQQRLLGDTGTAVASRVASRIELMAAIRDREAARLGAVLQAVSARLGG